MTVEPGRRHAHRTRYQWTRQPLLWSREVAFVSAALVVYFGGRVLVEGSKGRAEANARKLLEVESAIGLDIEADLQQAAIEHQVLEVLGNLAYVWLHWPLLIAALVILFLRDPGHYRQFRNALFVSGSIGLLLFATVPMAPPRFMPGFVGTVSDDARRHYLGYPLSWANRYAAFPSFHVGWTLIACLAVAASVRHRSVKLLALVPALLVGGSVITTGNHYVLDSVAGAAIALGAYIGFGRAFRPRPGRRLAASAGPVADAAHDDVIASGRPRRELEGVTS